MIKLIVEGPDGAGKTTLINQLRATFPIQLQPRVVDEKTNAMIDLKKWVEDDVTDGHNGIYDAEVEENMPRFRVYDRHRLISEPIYGPILRKEQQPGFNDQVWVLSQQRKFWSQYPTLIYCLPNPAAVWDNLKHDPHNTAVLDHWEAIYAAYITRAALDKLHRPAHVFVYDYTNPVPTITHIFSRLYSLMEED